MRKTARLFLPLLCLLVGLAKAPTQAFAAAGCGSCSFRGCSVEGAACTTLSGAPGQCINTGKLCGDHRGYCGCYAI